MTLRRLSFATLLLAAPLSARAGPWVPGRWHFYLQLRESFEIAEDRYDAAGDRRSLLAVVDASGAVAPSSFRQWLTDLYAEVGLATRLSVIADLRMLSAISQPIDGYSSRSAVGVSDLWTGAKLLLFDDELTAAVQVGVAIPLGSPTTAVPLGQGDVRTDFTLLVGKLFEHPNLFVSLEVGVRLRSSATVGDASHPGAVVPVQYSNEVRYAAAAGYQIVAQRRGFESLQIIVKLEGVYALQAAVEDGLGTLVNPAASYLKLGPELVWAPRRGVQVGLGGHYFVTGRSVPAFGEVALSLGYGR